MENKLLVLDELSTPLGRSPETIKKDLKHRRLGVMPRQPIPRTGLLRWRLAVANAWLASLVEPREGACNDRAL